jgi:hypothetical protein
MSGVEAGGLAPLVVPKPLGVAWLLLLAGPIGWLVLAAIYPKIAVRYQIKVPLGRDVFRRRLALLRRRLWCGWLGTIGVVAGLALRALGPIAAVIFGAGVAGTAIAISAHVRLPWTVPSARAEGAFVVLQGVNPDFAEAVAR